MKKQIINTLLYFILIWNGINLVQGLKLWSDVDPKDIDYTPLPLAFVKSVHDEDGECKSLLGGRKCGLCEGDCDMDSHCAEGLVCFIRAGRTNSAAIDVPGCSTNPPAYFNKDFCVDERLYKCRDNFPFRDLDGNSQTCEWVAEDLNMRCATYGIFCRQTCGYCRDRTQSSLLDNVGLHIKDNRACPEKRPLENHSCTRDGYARGIKCEYPSSSGSATPDVYSCEAYFEGIRWHKLNETEINEQGETIETMDAEMEAEGFNDEAGKMSQDVVFVVGFLGAIFGIAALCLVRRLWFVRKQQRLDEQHLPEMLDFKPSNYSEDEEHDPILLLQQLQQEQEEHQEQEDPKAKAPNESNQDRTVELGDDDDDGNLSSTSGSTPTSELSAAADNGAELHWAAPRKPRTSELSAAADNSAELHWVPQLAC